MTDFLIIKAYEKYKLFPYLMVRVILALDHIFRANTSNAGATKGRSNCGMYGLVLSKVCTFVSKVFEIKYLNIKGYELIGRYPSIK